MAERLSLELELLDKVGGPAKKAAAALRSVEDQGKKTQKALDFSKEVTRSRDQLNRLKLDPKGYTDLVKAQKALREEREKLKKSLQPHESHGFLSSFKHALPFRSVGDYFKGAFWGHLAAEGVEKIFEGFEHGAHAAVHIITHGLEHAFTAIAKEQERIAGFDLTLGKHGSETAREDIERFSKQTAFSPSQNMDMMLPLFRAGLKGQEARTAYAAALDLAAGRGKGSDKGAVSDAVELFAKIQQKGGITTKQLSSVGLGEYNVPAFYKDLGKYLHISAKEAEKRAATPGGIDPSILQDRLFAAIEKQQGGKLGTGAEMAGSSLFGMWNKLKELPEDFFEKLVNSPAIPKLTKAVSTILEKLDPSSPTGQLIVESLEKMFTRLGTFIEETITPENIDKFLNALAKIPDYLNTALKIGEALVVIFVGGKLVNAITAAVTGIATVSAPMLAISATVAAVAIAFERISKAVDSLGGLAAVKRDFVDFVSSGGMMLPAESKGNAGYAEYEEERKRNLERAKARQRSGVVVGDVNVTVHPAKDDTNHTGQAVADSVHKHMSNAMERAALEGG